MAEAVLAGSPESLISLSGVSKNFGSNNVLEGVHFDLRAGEIQALVGENGAGKSTCLGLLYGLHQPSGGNVLLRNKPVQIQNTAHAQALGIGCVFQELSLAGSLSVAENIFAGRAPSVCGVVKWSALYEQAQALLQEFDLSIDVSKPVDSLPVSSRQIVEIAKALSLNSRILLLDEPTSALTPDEVKNLFVVLRKLAAKGIGIVYVSHHLSEVFEIADKITVLRDGHTISSNKTSDTTETRVVAEMLGKSPSLLSEQQSRAHGAEILTVDNISAPSKFNNISFSLKRGEIIGFAGLVGSRRSEIVKTLVGLNPGYSGTVSYNGSTVRFRSIRHAMDAGIGYVPEERKTDGLFLSFPLSANVVATSLEKHTTAGIVRPDSIRNASVRAIDTFDIKTRGTEDTVLSLSGGNQQKILLSKWLERDPQLLIIEEPTKGVDVAARFQIHEKLRQRAAEGVAIIIVSSDFPELVSVTDRILVVHEGQLTGTVAAAETSEEALLILAAGIDNSSQNNNQPGNHP